MRGETHPVNLSRIILTLTCSPVVNQKLRTKFSSIQGSNSPILRRSVKFVSRDHMYEPESGLGITTGLTIELWLRELASGAFNGLHLPLGSWTAGTLIAGSGLGLARWVTFVILERHVAGL